MDIDSGNDDKKPLPDIIPQKKEEKRKRSRSDSTSPLPRRRSKSPESQKRKPSGDGDVSSLTEPSDREQKRKSDKWTPLKSVREKQVQESQRKSKSSFSEGFGVYLFLEHVQWGTLFCIKKMSKVVQKRVDTKNGLWCKK